jgi:hypothetical protein
MTSNEDAGSTSQATAEILAKVDTLERERERKRLRQRPLGVAIMAALLASFVLMLALLLADRWLHWQTVKAWIPGEELYDVTLTWFVFGPIALVWAGLLAYGIWNLQEWARHSITGTAVLGFARRVYGAGALHVFHRGVRGIRSERAALLQAIALILVAAYFQTPSIAAAFRSSLPRKQGSV